MGISPLPRKVKFGMLVGEVIDEVSCQRDFESVDCLFLIQQIRWSDDYDTIRFAYYTKPHGSSEEEWGYANRPPNMEPGALKELIRKAKGKSWFKHILNS